LATSRHRESVIAVKSKRRFDNGICTGSPTTAVKSHRSSSNIGRAASSGNTRPASPQTSIPVNGERCPSPWRSTVTVAVVVMR
jgi:hypothetical protein